MYDNTMLVRERMADQLRQAEHARLGRIAVEASQLRGSPPRKRLDEPCPGELRPALNRPA